MSKSPQGYVDMKTPVVFIIHKRVSTALKVFKAIREASPTRLLVVADGPRRDREGEVEKCAATRAIIDRVDWDCEVSTNFSEANLGCKIRISSGLNWAFDLVNEAIILEDDCVPHPNFFRFCSDLLDFYRDDKRIMSISGYNIQLGRKRSKYSYYFSRYPQVWGWATWKRAWDLFDVNMKAWPEVRDSNLLCGLTSDTRTLKYWERIFDENYSGGRDSWAYPLTFCFLAQNGLSIIPNVNLVSNIGFGEDASNTVASANESIYANMAVSEVEFPLRHPPFVIQNVAADEFAQNTFYHSSILWRIAMKAMKVSRRLLNLVKGYLKSSGV